MSISAEALLHGTGLELLLITCLCGPPELIIVYQLLRELIKSVYFYDKVWWCLEQHLDPLSLLIVNGAVFYFLYLLGDVSNFYTFLVYCELVFYSVIYLAIRVQYRVLVVPLWLAALSMVYYMLKVFEVYEW